MHQEDIFRLSEVLFDLLVEKHGRGSHLTKFSHSHVLFSEIVRDLWAPPCGSNVKLQQTSASSSFAIQCLLNIYSITINIQFIFHYDRHLNSFSC